MLQTASSTVELLQLRCCQNCHLWEQKTVISSKTFCELRLHCQLLPSDAHCSRSVLK